MDKPKITAKDFFLHAAILVTLYVSVASIITLLVETIDAAFPDTVANPYYYSYQGYTSGMRSAVASLIIIFPVFVFLSWWNHREIRREPQLKELSIKRWFAFLTLFLAGATILTDLVVFLNSFLGGEITTRFVLKVLAVLLVSGLVFLYHLFEIKRKPVRENAYRIFRGLAILIVLVAIAWSFIVIGSPLTARKLRFDEERVSDLNVLQSQILNYWSLKGRIPQSLSEMNDTLTGWSAPVDPETGAPYDYSAKGEREFELCATFTLSSPKVGETARSDSPVVGSVGVPDLPGFDNWQHAAGHSCVTRTIDPELYPPGPAVRPIK